MLRTTIVPSLLTLFLASPMHAQFGGLKGLLNKAKSTESAATRKDSAPFQPKSSEAEDSAPSESKSEDSPQAEDSEGSSQTGASGPSALPDPWPMPIEPFIVPSSIKVMATSHNCYQPKPGGDCKGTAWYPQIKFNLVGPLKQSTKLWVHWDMDGKPWFKQDFRALELTPNRVESMDSSQPVKAGWPSLYTGTVGFKITAEDALAGSSRVLYQGKFKASKHHTGNDSPLFKDQYGWFVSYDWALPQAYLEFDRSAESWPPLNAYFWFKDQYESNEEYTAHVFFNGKEITNVRGMIEWSIKSESEHKKVLHGWSLVKFFWRDLVAHHRRSNGASLSKHHNLGAHPGEYTIKVLRKGELVRQAPFTILPGGKLDDGLTKANQVRGAWTIIPAKVMGNSDGSWAKEAWKTDQLWANPMKGFQVPN